MKNRPENIDDYKTWLRKNHDIEISDRTKNYYDSVTNKLLECVENSDFWLRINKDLPSCNDQYLLNTSYHLLIPNFKPELVVKP
ncbi:MAG: hypothetical protein WA970_25345, partial [Gammaproteobacteria bacterium]